MPHSVFLGRVAGPSEPLWLPEDMDKALAYQDHLRYERSRRCPSCGTKPEDWVDADSGRPWREPAWIAEVHECLGCAAVDTKLQEQGHDAARHGRLRAATPADFLDLD